MTPFADLPLARRLETSDGHIGEHLVNAYARLRPDAGATPLRIASGWALYLGTGSPATHAVGIGMQGGVGLADVEQMEEFYRCRGSAVHVELCPLADPSLLQLLGDRGYRLASFSNVLVRPVASGGPAAAAPPAIRVREAEAGEAAAWAQLVASGFADGGDAPPWLAELFLSRFGMPESACFVAEAGGKPIAGGAIAMHDGVAWLSGTSTLPEYRGGGVHAALLGARLAYAAAAGCDLAAVRMTPGGTSQRNAERQGFRVVYTRCRLVREWQTTTYPGDGDATGDTSESPAGA